MDIGGFAEDMGGVAQQCMKGQLLKNGRGDELERDALGALFMLKAGYNPEEMIGVMEVLKDVAGPNRVPEFQNSHPDPKNRIDKIREPMRTYKNAS